mgnify:CR=1 FL=1
MPAQLSLRLLGVVFFVAANAFFVAAEFALVSVRATRLRQLEGQGHAAARTALRLQKEIDRVLSATQLGITLASLALGWIGEQAVAEPLLALFQALAPGPRLALAHTLALAIAFLIITALHLVLGEVVPKNVALARGGQLALLLAPPMELFMRLTRPFLRVMDASASAISRLFGAGPAAYAQPHSPEELKMLVTAEIERGLLPEEVEAMIHGVFDLHKTLVREIMVPRPDIVSLRVDAPLEEAVAGFLKHQHGRMPVYEGSPENFIGVVYAGDLLRAWQARQVASPAARPPGPFKLRSLVRDVPIVPETKPVGQLLEEFKRRRRSLALAVDEYGSIAGLVTMADIVRRIVGGLEEEAVPASEAGSVVLEGSTHIRELEERFRIRVPRERGFETVAGLVMNNLGRIPRPGDTFVHDGWRFTVEAMEGHRIASVRLEKVA